MAEKLRRARLYLVLLGIFALGRWLQGMFGVPYERGHHVFSLVMLTALSAIYYGAFTRRLYSYSLMQAVVLAFVMGLISQLVIFLLTVASYALDMHTFFNHPRALNREDLTEVPFALALQNRAGGLIGNSIFAGIAGALGWALGALLPERSA
jgi:hypothetical protein